MVAGTARRALPIGLHGRHRLYDVIDDERDRRRRPAADGARQTGPQGPPRSPGPTGARRGPGPASAVHQSGPTGRQSRLPGRLHGRPATGPLELQSGARDAAQSAQDSRLHSR